MGKVICTFGNGGVIEDVGKDLYWSTHKYDPGGYIKKEDVPNLVSALIIYMQENTDEILCERVQEHEKDNLKAS